MKALIAGLVVALAGAGLGGAVLTGTLPLMTKSAEPEPGTGWEVLETFTGEAGDLTEGTLDLRTFWGNIQVTGWDQPGYEITVYQRAPEQSGQRLSDAGIEAVFEETREAGLGLSLLVQRTGTYDIHVNEDSWTDIAVVANVPGSIAWSTAYICSGETSPGRIREALAPILGALWDGSEEDDRCVDGSPMPSGSIGSINLMDESEEEEVYEFPFALANLNGGELTVHAQYADLALDGLAFAKAGIATAYGDILGTIDAPELAVHSQYGDIGLTTVTDTAEVMSQYGDLYLSFGPGETGAYNVVTHYGEVVVGLVNSPDRGYDAQATTEYGEALIILDGITYGAEEDEDDGAALLAKAAGLPALLNKPDPPAGRDYEHGATVKAQSEGFDTAPIQVVVKALTEYGDLLITDGEMPEAEEDEDTAA